MRSNGPQGKDPQMTTAEQAIQSYEAEILRLQIAIAEERERGGEMAEGTRLMMIAELRGEIEFCQSNAAAINELEAVN